ncbi:unnamed protein product [Effrenium voratum]|nr:unnamed protein product [Effrenium voratum]
MGYYHSGLASFPLVPGHEWAGEILALGPGALDPRLRVGQRVVGEHCTGCEPAPRCNVCQRRGGLLRCPRRKETGFFGRDGAFQTELVFPAAQLHALPKQVTDLEAVLAEPLCTALKAVRLADVDSAPKTSAGPRVAVVGDGAVGLLLLQALRWRHSARVLLLGARKQRLQRARELGAEACFDVAEPGLPGALEEHEELPSVVLEAAGTPEAVRLALRCCAAGGTVVLLGLSGNKPAELCPDDVVLRQIVVKGSLSSEPEDWAQAAEMLAQGALQSVVTHVFEGLDKYQEAIEKVRSPPDDMIKAVVKPWPESRKRSRE